MDCLSGRVAIITGASKGIGRVMSQLFAREGANVVCAARSAALVEETAARSAATAATQLRWSPTRAAKTRPNGSWMKPFTRSGRSTRS